MWRGIWPKYAHGSPPTKQSLQRTIASAKRRDVKQTHGGFAGYYCARLSVSRCRVSTVVAAPEPSVEALAVDHDDGHTPHIHGSLGGLMLGATGVVFGDIGTSPLYALQATLDPHYHLDITHPAAALVNLYGLVSLIFWTFLFVVTLKYVFIVMRCDNHGEGGSLALFALIRRQLTHMAEVRWLMVLALFATALFYSDSMLTPAISVISAVEGLEVVSTAFDPYIVGIALVILIGLFAIQSHGTDRVGKLFGPVMTVYFFTIGVMGVAHIIHRPEVIWALSPTYIYFFFTAHPMWSFLALGAVIYAVTGAEALYADMGHFGRKPISYAWLFIAMPMLMLNYLGQAALLIENPSYVDNPFFHMVPHSLTWPLLILATLATIIASQAVISGAFSVTQQAIQLGFMPRLEIRHTSSKAEGQIYVPAVNWFLATMVALLVIVFQHSAKMLPAYGLAVVGTMIITTAMQYVVVFQIWKVAVWRGVIGLIAFLTVDGIYLASGLAKLFEGAWFPIMVGLIIFTLLTTWSRGRELMRERLDEASLPLQIFIESACKSATRVKGTAVFMTSTPDGVPPALLHNLKHNKVLHERIVLLTVKIRNIPIVPDEERCAMADLGHGFHRLVLKFGFMQETDVATALQQASMCGGAFKMMDTSFFLARQTLLPSDRPGMAVWREHLFSWMLRNATSAMDFFRLPPNRVVELGSQVEI